MTYTANSKTFESFFAAVSEAKKSGCTVTLTADGSTKWVPAKAKKVKVTHFIRNEDGSRKVIGYTY